MPNIIYQMLNAIFAVQSYCLFINYPNNSSFIFDGDYRQNR